MSSTPKYPINVETKIAAFEKQTGTEADAQIKTFLTLLAKFENQVYQQGRSDERTRKADDITRLPAPLNCIRRVILSDGTVYDNVVYENTAPILTGAELGAATGFDLEKWRADCAARPDTEEEELGVLV